jgi:hypothetical protein
MESGSFLSRARSTSPALEPTAQTLPSRASSGMRGGRTIYQGGYVGLGWQNIAGQWLRPADERNQALVRLRAGWRLGAGATGSASASCNNR